MAKMTTKYAEKTLKPCPFCGGKAHAYQSGLFETDTQTGAACLICGANIDEDTEEKAIEVWNRRV